MGINHVMEIRQSTLQDLDRIMDVYAKAKLFMASTGNGGQWINGYPSRDLITEDIHQGYSHVIVDPEQEVVSVFYFRIGEDPTYLHIYDGQWLNDAPYGVIHRLAGNGKVKGLASLCFDWCFRQCGNLRVDTHRNNLVMQHILQRNGFIRCGIIYIADGTERIAYQKRM